MIDEKFDDYQKLSKEIDDSLEIEEVLIEHVHSKEIDYFVGHLVEIKIVESSDSSKFKKIVQSLINVITSDDPNDNLKLHTTKILRRISNFRKDLKINIEIQKDLVEIGLMDTLCMVTALEESDITKIEYIMGLVDFLDEANRDIQESFYKFLVKNEDNK